MDLKFEQDFGRGSICGSIGGDVFASQGRRSKKSSATRKPSIVSITKRFDKQYLHDIKRQESFVSSIGSFENRAQVSSKPEVEKRFNNFFHHFRFIVVMFGGFSLGMMLFLRYNITVAILNMVNQTAIYIEEHPNNTIEDFYNEGYTVTGGEFNWDNEIQHMIMSWYMIAYTLPQIPCTTLGLKLGIRWAIPFSLALCSLSALLTPTMSYWGWRWVIGLRLMMGISGSAIMPMLLCVVESWMPYDQMTLGLTCAQLVQTIVSAANPLVSGYLCAIHWKYAFYVPAIVTLVFCALWAIIVTNHPDENWFVSLKEVELIDSTEKIEAKEEGCNQTVIGNDLKVDIHEEPRVEPVWKDIFRVPCIYAYMIMWCFYCSPYSVFVFILPTYMRQFLKISVEENGLYCFIIMTGSLVSVTWPHPLLRFFNEKMQLTWTTSRRLAYLIVCSLVGLTWLYVGTFHSAQLIVLWINRCFHGSNDIVVTGNLMSNFAKAGLSSVAFSVMNTIGNLSVVFSSTFCGYVLDITGQSEEGWTYIFYGLATTQLIVFIIFSTCIRAGPVDFHMPKKSSFPSSGKLNLTIKSSVKPSGKDSSNISSNLAKI